MNDKVIAVVGLGYVGLPLAAEFGKLRKVIGFDINKSRINDGMGAFVASQFIKAASQAGLLKTKMRVLILGVAFKEDCPDLRNTRVVDVISELRSYGAEVDVHDPEVSSDEAHAEYGIELVAAPEKDAYDGIILAVPHQSFVAQSALGLRSYGLPDAHIFYDLKSVFEPNESDLRL